MVNHRGGNVKQLAVISGLMLLALISSVSAQVTIIDATDNSVTLRWLAPGDDGTNGTATAYEIRYGSALLDVGNFASANLVSQTLTPLSSGTVQTYQVTALDPQVTSYIALRAADEAGNQSEITNSVVVVPPSGSGTVDIDPSAQAFSVTVPVETGTTGWSYYFQVDDNPDFNSPTTVDASINNALAAAQFDDLSPLYLYYWRYRFESPDGTNSSFYSVAGEVDLIEGLADGQPAPPTSVWPAANDTISTLIPDLIVLNGFDLEGDPLTYQFQLFDQSGKTLLLSDSNLVETIDSTSWTVPAGLLDLGRTYQWQARCFDGFQYSPWSIRHSFYVQPLSSNLAESNVIPDPYPSPVHFMSGDLLQFEFPDTPVTLRILNSAGELVYLAADVTGYFTWNGLNGDGHQISSGVYLWYVSDDLGEGKFIVLP